MIRRTAALLAGAIFGALALAMPAHAADGTAPVVRAVTVSKDAVKIGPSPKQVTIRARVTDGGSGVAKVYMLAEHTGHQGQWSDTMTRVSGTATDGWYAYTLNLPGHTAIGRWGVNIGATDKAGHSLNLAAGYSATFRTLLAQKVTLYATTTQARSDGTVLLAGNVVRYSQYGATEWAPYGAQDVRILFRPDSRYVFSVKATVNVDSRGLFHVRVHVPADGRWYGQVTPTATNYGDTSRGFAVTR